MSNLFHSTFCLGVFVILFMLDSKHQIRAAFKASQTTGISEGSGDGQKPTLYRHSGKVAYSYATDKHRFLPRTHRGRIFRRHHNFHRKRPRRLGGLHVYDRPLRFRFPFQFREYVPTRGHSHYRYYIRPVRPMFVLPNFRPRRIAMTRPWVMYPEFPISRSFQQQFYGGIPHQFQDLAGDADSCYPNPCYNGGRCLRMHADGMFRCICKRGFTGLRCRVLRSKCHPNPCVNGGSCTDVKSGYECACQAGYKGLNCQEEAKCTHDPCENGGTCTEMDNGFQCTCTKGYRGKTCHERNPCNSNPCFHGGTCVETDTGFDCVCPPEWACRDCRCKAEAAIKLSLCDPSPCKNGGTCRHENHNFRCYCPTGFTGVTCEVSNYCVSEPCLNEGRCSEVFGGYRCHCTEGFRGKNCETENQCKPFNPCNNGGRCVETEDGYKCHCKLGFYGDSCETRDYCKPNPCKSGGTCVAEDDGYLCLCPPDYRGINCQSRQMCKSNLCLHGGTCIDLDNNIFKCLCSDQWLGRRCEARNPCHTNPCGANGHCQAGSSSASFTCKCRQGFQGPTCQIRNPCEPNPCHHDAICTTSGETYVCACPDGLIGHRCEKVDPCYPNPCTSGGSCHRNPDDNGFKCLCIKGRAGDLCDIEDPCNPFNPCMHNGQCVALSAGQYHCNCLLGFVGPVCEAPDPCRPSPCTHNSTCVNVGTTFRCECEPDWTGTFCERQSKCRPNPCKNDGTCRDVNVGRGYVCYCSIAYVGPSCEDKNKCHPVNPCKNGGTCRTDGHSVVCKCQPGYVGTHCQESNLCYNNPCRNGGSCTPKLEDFECDCRPQFYGKTCEDFSTPCSPDPCKNGGLCTEDQQHRNGFQCICKEGFTGTTCDRRDMCMPSPCQNGGRCLVVNSHRGYHCICNQGWHGYRCERNDHCHPDNPCLHNGKCYNTDTGFSCMCTPQYTGKFCGVDKCSRCDVNAKCVNGSCECNSNFVGNGFSCTEIGNPCQPNPCQNNGGCVSGHGGKVFECVCPKQYTGARCEVRFSACASTPCTNGGTCVDLSNNDGSLIEGVVLANRQDYRCICSRGYAGTQCDKVVLVNPCQTRVCANGGTCFDGTNSRSKNLKLLNALDFRCFCPAGYSGRTCEVPRYPCYSSPCLHGGRCIDSSNTADVAFGSWGYKCLCHEGFTGINCEVQLIDRDLPTQPIHRNSVTQSVRTTAQPTSQIATQRKPAEIPPATQRPFVSPISIQDRPATVLAVATQPAQRPAVPTLPLVQLQAADAQAAQTTMLQPSQLKQSGVLSLDVPILAGSSGTRKTVLLVPSSPTAAVLSAALRGAVGSSPSGSPFGQVRLADAYRLSYPPPSPLKQYMVGYRNRPLTSTSPIAAIAPAASPVLTGSSPRVPTAAQAPASAPVMVLGSPALVPATPTRAYVLSPGVGPVGVASQSYAGYPTYQGYSASIKSEIPSRVSAYNGRSSYIGNPSTTNTNNRNPFAVNNNAENAHEGYEITNTPYTMSSDSGGYSRTYPFGNSDVRKVSTRMFKGNNYDPSTNTVEQRDSTRRTDFNSQLESKSQDSTTKPDVLFQLRGNTRDSTRRLDVFSQPNGNRNAQTTIYSQQNSALQDAPLVSLTYPASPGSYGEYLVDKHKSQGKLPKMNTVNTL